MSKELSAKPRVLLVDDAADVRLLVARSLERDYEVETASDLASARQRLGARAYDLLVLDLHLPDGTGLELYDEAKERWGSVPAIFLSADGELDRKLEAFQRGAEDYVVKPVDPRELLARVKSRLEKRTPAPSFFVFGPLEVDLEKLEARLKDDKGTPQRLDLTPHELKLLFRLVQNRGRVLSRAQLIEQVWGSGFFIEERTVDRHLSALRKKLGASQNFVKTVPGFGYMFTDNAQS